MTPPVVAQFIARSVYNNPAMAKRFKLSLLLFLLVLVFLRIGNSLVWAQEESRPVEEETLEGRVVSISEEQADQRLEILVTRGSLVGEEITVAVGGDVTRVGEAEYAVGDELVVSHTKDFAGNDVFYVTDFVRRAPLQWLFLIFVVLVAAVGRWRGLSSLLGMGLSFLVIFKFILPQIMAGRDPVLIAILGALLIIPLTFYLSHGLSRKTTVAVVGTMVSLVFTGLLAEYFIGAARLTGFASEEAGFLQVIKPGLVNIKGLVLAGIIIGVLGVLDDITVAQAAVVEQLRQSSPLLGAKELFFRAMRIGQDHIASMVNTLILVYTGASLPLLLLFVDNRQPFLELVNYEMIAEEIIRTLVGSIGLVLAVPLTTFLASFSRPRAC